MPTNEDLHQKLKTECYDKSLHAFAFNFLFDKRAQKYSVRIRLLNVVGLLVPALIGVTAINYKDSNDLLKDIIPIAGIVMTIQFGVSIWSVLFDWANGLSYSYEASQDYNSFWVRYKKLSQYPPTDFEKFKTHADLLNTEVLKRNQQDSKYNIKDWELRRGHRAALREYQMECSGCKTKPLSLKSTECDVCGNFKFKLLNN